MERLEKEAYGKLKTRRFCLEKKKKKGSKMSKKMKKKEERMKRS